MRVGGVVRRSRWMKMTRESPGDSSRLKRRPRGAASQSGQIILTVMPRHVRPFASIPAKSRSCLQDLETVNLISPRS